MNYFAILIFLSIIISVPSVFAEGPEIYDVAISLIGIGEINKQIGSYELDFWYSIFSEDKNLLTDGPPPIDFMNGRDETFSSEYLASNIFEQRVRGVFVSDMDFKNFPFEKIILKVELEPVTPYDTDNVIFRIDPASGIDSSATVPGWSVTEPTFSIGTKIYGNGEEYSRFTAEYTIERSFIGTFLKIIFPVLIVLSISFLAYIIPEHFDVSAALTLLPLLAVIFLHIDTLDQLPVLGYLTIFDKILLISYALIANNIICTSRLVRSFVYHGAEQSRQVNKFHLILSPIIIISLAIPLFLFL